MNQKAKTTISLLQKKLPTYEDTLLVMAFGSQVRGTEHPDSDLDILHVVRDGGNESKMADIKTLGASSHDAIEKMTILEYTDKSILDWGNLYGRAEYNAIRKGRIIFKREPVASELLKKFNGRTRSTAIRRWLEFAKSDINVGKQWKTRDVNIACFMMQRSIDACLKTVLLFRNVEFTRLVGIRAHYKLMTAADRRLILDKLDIDRIASWQYNMFNKYGKYDDHDYTYASMAARSVYDSVERLTSKAIICYYVPCQVLGFNA